jgi:hypothetical protein
MSHERKKPAEQRVSAVWIVIALLIIYPLSVGPVAFAAGAASDSALVAIGPAYEPLWLIGDFAPPFRTLTLQYCRQCFRLGLSCRRDGGASHFAARQF